MERKIFAILLTVAFLTRVLALPRVERSASDKDKVYDADDYSGTVTLPNPVLNPVSESVMERCTINVTRVFNRKIYQYDFTLNVVTEKIVEESVTAEQCCEDWEGDDCNARIHKPDNSPCGNITCEAVPDAQCAIIKRCGVDIPLFIDNTGLVVKECLSEDRLCLGICKTNPCLGLTCDQYPEAMCFTSGCGCEPVWLLPSKERVLDCSKANKQRRQVESQCE